MNPHIFRGFSIRGRAEEDLPDSVVEAIGRAIGTYFARQGRASLVVGYDVRPSSPRLSRVLSRALAGSGLTVTGVGLVPTPALNFAVDHLQAGGGVMVTASHNPSQDNGCKVRAAETLYGAALQDIYRLAAARDFVNGQGRFDEVDILPAYQAVLAARASLKRPLTVVIDGGNGANGQVMAALLRDLGCAVHELFCEPDGRFPNRTPDPTRPGALDALARTVLQQRADVGLAYDGDGDRVVAVDDRGRVHLGDRLLILLARDLLQNGPATVVHDVSCSQALVDEVQALGGRAVAAPVGYAFVHRRMREVGAALAGETAGHLFFDDPDIRFDDALLASVRLLSILSQSEASFSSLIDRLPVYYPAPPLRIACPDALKGQVVENVRATFAGDYPIDALDGARVDFGDGWALIRQSNTQPAITVHLEATSARRLNELRPRVLAAVARGLEVAGHTPPPELYSTLRA